MFLSRTFFILNGGYQVMRLELKNNYSTLTVICSQFFYLDKKQLANYS
ncbi:hypothetical protein D1AOALGA4SA_4826 [Olavius algarvensis Delta 1 endosymbiont]|nr:hypothetical protein D1AOALGA4SA_4826 [Olavius algarvensis Delta 1 endosymbiont]